MTVTTDEAAEYAGVTAATLRGWVLKGWLEPVRRGAKPLRFDYDEVARCQREHRPATWSRHHAEAVDEWTSLVDPDGHAERVRSARWKRQEQQFHSHVAIGPDSECWQWLGAIGSWGYGKVQYRGRSTSAHRVAWMIANQADLVPSEVVDHLCENKLCVNPRHLEPCTNAENIRRSWQRRRARAAALAGATASDVQR